MAVGGPSQGGMVARMPGQGAGHRNEGGGGGRQAQQCSHAAGVKRGEGEAQRCVTAQPCGRSVGRGGARVCREMRHTPRVGVTPHGWEGGNGQSVHGLGAPGSWHVGGSESWQGWRTRTHPQEERQAVGLAAAAVAAARLPHQAPAAGHPGQAETARWGSSWVGHATHGVAAEESLLADKGGKEGWQCQRHCRADGTEDASANASAGQVAREGQVARRSVGQLPAAPRPRQAVPAATHHLWDASSAPQGGGRQAGGVENGGDTQRRQPDRKSTRLNSSHITRSRMPSSA